MPEELNSYYRETLEIHTTCVREVFLIQESCSNAEDKNFTSPFFKNVWKKLVSHFIGFDTVKLVIYT